MYIETVGQIENQKTVEDMEVGETCYAVPWAVEYDNDGYVSSFSMDMEVEDSSGGPGVTTALAITKRGENDYIFDVSRCGWYKRKPTRKNHPPK